MNAKDFLIDSHCHLEDKAFDSDRDAVYKRALAANVKVMILAGSDIESSRRIAELVKKYRGVYGLVGIHPHEASKVSPGYLKELKELLTHPKILGIGEIGLDFYYDNSPRDLQETIFKQQLQLAKELGKVFVIHSREASFKTVEILKEVGYHHGIFHCYSYSVETLREILALGYYISLGGPVTFKNAKRPVQVAGEVPLDRLLLETDAPYLTPEPFRGRRNEPAYVVHVASEIAKIKGLAVDKVAKACYQNTEKFFGIKFERAG